MYTAVNEAIEQHTAVRYDSCSQRTAMTFCLHQTPTYFNSSPLKAKCGLSAVFVRSVEWADGVGRTGNSAAGAGLSYLMNRVTPRNI